MKTAMNNDNLLEVTDLAVSYRSVPVLFDVSFSVRPGEIVALLGPNAAGKSTLLNTVAGLLRPSAGEVVYRGTNVHRFEAHEVVARGLCLVPENRLLFPDMSVGENLELGAYPKHARSERVQSLQQVYELFPVIAKRERQQARTLSGGEQQMLAIGRGLMAKPRLLMLDEPSLGLAPLVVEEVFKAVEAINRHGIAVLIVEQHTGNALRLAHRAYVLESGRITREGRGEDLLSDEGIRQAYFGL